MMKICLLVSGGLGLQVLQELKSKYQIVSVFTDRGSVAITEACKEYGIPVFVGNPRSKPIDDFIRKLECEILLSVNYLFIINSALISLPSKYAINVHGSLLPKYRGRTPHVWAIINGEQETGITAHLIEEEVDAGAIIGQISVPITAEDTGATILEKYNKLYPQLISNVLEQAVNGTLVFTVQNNALATYFGKRTPEDGRINWDWSKERIRNWVRAQAAPYPGAFAYYKGERFIINCANFDDTGYRYDNPNGLILKAGEDTIIVKTNNGALCLSKLAMPHPINFEEGTILE